MPFFKVGIFCIDYYHFDYAILPMQLVINCLISVKKIDNNCCTNLKSSTGNGFIIIRRVRTHRVHIKMYMRINNTGHTNNFKLGVPCLEKNHCWSLITRAFFITKHFQYSTCASAILIASLIIASPSSICSFVTINGGATKI